MSDFFLLASAIALPFPSYPRWPLLHTLCLSHAVWAPQAPSLPFFLFFFCSVFTCDLSLNVQCLFCSGVLRPSQWIGSSFGAEVTAFPIPPTTPPFLSFPFLPLLLLSSPQGRRPAWEMVPTCAAWWMAALLRVHVPWLRGGGRGCDDRVSCVVPSPRPPSAPLSFWRGGDWNHPRSLGGHPGTTDSGCRSQWAHSSLGVGRNKPSCFRRRRFVPLGQICCAV